MSVESRTTELPYFDSRAPEVLADQHGALRAMRERSSIVRTPTGLGVLTYDACNAVLADPAFRPAVFELTRRASPDGRGLEPGRTLLGTEGDDHRELRRMVMPWFTPRHIESLRARTAALVERLLDPIEKNGRCEFVSDVARHVPPAVFCWMVGCDVEHGPQLAEWSETALRAFSGDPAVMGDVRTAIRSLRQFAAELAADKVATPGDDITSALLTHVDAGHLTVSEVQALLTELLSASVDNTMHAISLTLWLLARHPEQWRLLADDHSLLTRTFEEAARFEPRIREGRHLNDGPARVLGFEVPPGTIMTVFIAAAHRDPAAYPDPDTFDITRRPQPPQLEFGIGRHHCIGAALARMEVEEVLRAVTARWELPQIRSRELVATDQGEVLRLPLTIARRDAREENG